MEGPGRYNVIMAVPDKGLDVLLDEIDSIAPGRDKGSDGWIGDPDHQTRTSDHNPEDSEDADFPGNPDDQVDARDFTHDPDSGADMRWISEQLRLSLDRRIKYVIFNRRIFSSYATATRKAWEWGPYSGSNPHDHHMHVSVVDRYHDEIRPWGIDDMSAEAEQRIKDLHYATFTDSGKNRAIGSITGELDLLKLEVAAVKTQLAEIKALIIAGQGGTVDPEALVNAMVAEIKKRL